MNHFLERFKFKEYKHLNDIVTPNQPKMKKCISNKKNQRRTQNTC